MQDFKHIGRELKKNIEQMKTLTDDLLQKAQEKEPGRS
jgi:hypothetical protein